ncbi:hypothetical protein [Methylomonas sp. HYX-M1]|uniref:hypothetical protein n=1 Tax=Methylomonas sp. HYX-M1 TaxID=3139307 RepID=UPI00345B55CE
MTLKKNAKYLQIAIPMAVMLGGNIPDASALTTPGVTPLGKPTMITNNYGLVSFQPQTFFLANIPSEFRHYFTSQVNPNDPKTTGQVIDENLDGDNIAGELVEYGNYAPKSVSQAAVENTGLYLSYAEYNKNFRDPEIWGVASDTTFIQSFRKDSADAQLKFTITAAELKTEFDFGTGIADFTTDIRAWDNSDEFTLGEKPFAEFHQHAGIHDQYGGLYYPSFTSLEKSGPMTYAEETDSTNGSHFHKVKFDPYTGTLDLSSIDVGEEFTVEMYSMALAMGMYGEFGQSAAYFKDPLSQTGGVQLEVIGLTPTDNPRVPAVPLPASVWLFVTGILSLLLQQRHRVV